MSIQLRQWSSLVATLLVSCSALAQPATELPNRVLSLNLANIEASARYRLSAEQNELGITSSDADVGFASAEGAALAWGIEDGNGRVMLEYYYSDINLDYTPFASTGGTPSLQTHGLFYSGYWVPDIYWGVKGILGGGIGYAEQTLKNAQPDDLSERGWAYKFSGGLEYALIRNLSLYLLVERIHFNDINDNVELSGADDPATVAARRELQDNEQTRVGLGINFRY